jgi:hypothetical protein
MAQHGIHLTHSLIQLYFRFQMTLFGAPISRQGVPDTLSVIIEKFVGAFLNCKWRANLACGHIKWERENEPIFTQNLNQAAQPSSLLHLGE